MARTLSTGMAGHIAGNATTLAQMLRLDLNDGATYGFTDHNKTLSFDLGDGAIDYRPDTGVIPSDLSLSAGFEADEIEISGPITDSITAAAIIGGRFDGATARLFRVNWRDLSSGSIKLLKGYVALAEISGERFKLTVHSEAARYAQTIGRVITGYCDADFQDARCGYSEAATAATVTGATDEREFAVSFSGTIASNYFNRGTVTFLTGDLTGTRPVEVFDFAGGTGGGTLALYAPLAAVPAVGDTLEIRRGCEKTRAACMAYSNIDNFRGFPDVPGSDQVLRYPNPGGG